MRNAFVVFCLLAVSSVAAAQPAGYALIVTNNRSQSSSRPDLHYADDDGVQYAQLFGELLGADRVTLLTQLDRESAALHPETAARAPTHANLDAAVQQLAAALDKAHRSGERAVVYLVFAGHGDIDRGQGYLDLADGRLTARELDERVIQPLQADRIHLILDSCNSYFLLNPRKPGGKRWGNQQNVPRDLLSKYPRLGAILSTSAEAVTYEWSEIQSGVFSYEVRAGLRGAADVNSDGRITYAELSGFIRVANRPVVNDLYRPKVFSRAPAADAQSADALLAQLPSVVQRRLLLGEQEDQRLTLRDRQGVRLIDVHKEAGTALSLTLPPDVALSVQQQVPGAERPEFFDRELPPEGEQRLDALPAQPADRLGRGEPPLFSMLFAEPFGEHAFERVQAEARTPDEPPSGVTERDVERLRLHLSLMASSAKETRIDMAMCLLSTGTIPTAALTYSVFRNSDRRGDWIDRTGFAAGLTLSVVTLGIATYFLTTPWSEERLYDSFSGHDYSTERARSRGIPRVELELKAKAEESRRGRDIASWALLIGGAVNTIQGGVLLAEDIAGHDSVRVAAPITLLIGLGQIIFGWYLRTTKSSLENTWAAYSQDPAVQQRNEE